MNTAFETFARRVVNATVSGADFDALCRSESLTDLALYDALANHIAVGYNSGEWSFEHADMVMNRLWAFLTSRVSGDEWEIPQRFLSIYEAFDAGEHYHDKDSRDIDPEEKYTKPLIAEILSRP